MRQRQQFHKAGAEETQSNIRTSIQALQQAFSYNRWLNSMYAVCKIILAPTHSYITYIVALIREVSRCSLGHAPLYR